MYGRCETDPFDQATDVCDSCYGEFCSACMVRTKGRKHPICKECAIIASGVRPGAKPLLRGSKKTAAERRRTLQEAPSAPPPFEYFDDAADADGAGPVTGEPVEEAVDDHPADESTGPATDPECAEATDHAGAEGPDADRDDPVIVADQTSLPGISMRTAVNPGLAALARQHQADRRDDLPDLDDEPGPAWLTGEGDEPAETGRNDHKPVTDGFDWVTELPPRGSSTPLPSRTGRRQPGADAGGGEPQPASAGAVATADRPPPPLPRRRSKLRPPDDPG